MVAAAGAFAWRTTLACWFGSGGTLGGLDRVSPPVDRSVTRLPLVAPAISSVLLRPNGRRLHPGPYPGFAPDSTEQSGARLFDDFEFGIICADAELIQGEIFRLIK
ncbi:MAG: hypothetical protein M3431_10720 [Actinomycetota bacterium]|nr:hypothetical protein [Actinomycetota bacterium]